MTLITPKQCTQRRKRVGLSQLQLSAKAGLRPNYVCRFEGGSFREPSGEKLVKIANALLAEEKIALAALSGRREGTL